MIKITRWRGEKDFYKSLIRIERNVMETTEEFLGVASDWLVADIRKSWSLRSPSTGGEPPALDRPRTTGNLDSSVIAEKQGRMTGGQFAGKSDAQAWYIRVDTAKGDDPQGRGGYSQALERGTHKMQARPFMQPAIDRLSAIYEDLAKRYIKT